MTADIHSCQEISTASNKTLSQATMMVFTPKVGVATETSPFSKASIVKAWPPTNKAPVTRGCQSFSGSIAPSPKGSKTKKHVPEMKLDTKVVRQTPTLYMVARLKNSIANTKVTPLNNGNRRYNFKGKS